MEVIVTTGASDVSASVEFLSVAYLGEKGQLTIPKQYRALLDMDAGAPVAILKVGAALLLLPENERFRRLCGRISAVFATEGIDADDVTRTLPGVRRKVFKELYPELAASKRHTARSRLKTRKK